MNWRGWLAALAVLPLAGCAFLSPPDTLHPVTPAPHLNDAAAGPIQVGAATVDITPQRPVYMAGFRILKTSRGVHDPITARAIAIRRGGLTAVVIGCDLIGLHNYQVQQVRERLSARGVATRDAVLIASTHTHAGPDTFGLWGLPPIMTGRDEAYVARALDGIALAAERAVRGLGPVVVRWGSAQAPARGISKNRRAPELIDRTLTAIAFDRPGGRPVATLVHYACHPETLGSKNRLLSADFPDALRARVERGRPGSVAVFLNGALGGMVTVDRQGPPSLAGRLKDAERIGTALGKLALKALQPGKRLPRWLELRVSRRPIYVPIELRAFQLANLFGLFGPRPFFDGGYTLSEVMALRLGPIVLLTAPGEVLPKLGFELDAMNAGRPGLLIGLGNDELGYIIPEDDWADPRYHYERGVSPGRLMAGLLRATARRALADVGALRTAPAPEPAERPRR